MTLLGSGLANESISSTSSNSGIPASLKKVINKKILNVSFNTPTLFFTFGDNSGN